ncbi:MAG: AAA family ATPase [Spirochaetales bacterium]|nr:AAA family ATPase [Spirochaetales bacterium]
METDLDKLLEDANQFFFKNDYEKAEKLYGEILASNARHAPSLQKLARIELARHRRTKAAEYFERSLESNPEDVNTWNDLGNVRYDLKEYEAASDCYRKAIKLQPDFYWAYFNIGLALRQRYPNNLEKVEEARTWFERTLSLNPDYYPAVNEIGLYHLDRDEIRLAEECFQRAASLCPGYKYPYFNLAIIRKKEGDAEGSKRYLEKALECDPEYVPALNNLGIMYYDAQDFGLASFYYARALEIDPEYLYALYNLGLVFAFREEYGKAYALFSRAVALNPSYENALVEKNRLEREVGDELSSARPLEAEDLASDTYRRRNESLGKVESDRGEEGGRGSETQTRTMPVVQPEAQYYTEKFGRNITRMARDGRLFDVLGREKEIRSVLEVLLKIKKNNPLIVGMAGVGKTAIVEGIAERIVKGDVPEYFKNKEILEINMGMLVAGTQFRGDFEKRLSRIVEEVTQNENLILFIDEIHTALGAGETIDGSLDAANILKPALARGELRCIGATTTEEYNKHFVKDQAFLRRFYPIHVEELDKESTYRILHGLHGKISEHYRLEVDDSLLRLIVNVADDEIKNRVFPDKAIDILENACSRAALDGKTSLDDATVKAIIAEFVGMKFLEIESDHGERLLHMETFLKARIFGQDEAIERTSRIVRLAKQKLDLKPEQPDGVFLFAGPTGVGKTYLARQLARFLYGAEDKCLTINLAEYSESHATAKLIGSPPGYVGHDDVPLLSRVILENPSSLLLLDEVEKAHPEVLKLFLQIFDEGRITDTKGRVIYFSNVTVVMTSNVGLRGEAGIGFTAEGEKSKIDLARFFPQEFLNRIDEIIFFKPIAKETARLILTNLIIKRAVKAFARKGIRIEFDPVFIDAILERGYSAAYGVRNLERTFEKEVLSEVANHMYLNPQRKVIHVTREKGSIAVS